MPDIWKELESPV